MPTESVSRDGVRDGIYLVVRSAALEPRVFDGRVITPDAQYNGRYIVCSLILREKYACKATGIAPHLPQQASPFREFAEEGHS